MEEIEIVYEKCDTEKVVNDLPGLPHLPYQNQSNDAQEQKENFQKRLLTPKTVKPSSTFSTRNENCEPQVCALGGVKIKFPSDLKPYKSQLTLMAKAVTGARKAQNCLLESPTGSGKTMAILCSLLAWQNTVQEEIHASQLAAKTLNFAQDADTTPVGSPVVVKHSEAKVKNRMQFMEEKDWSLSSSFSKDTAAAPSVESNLSRSLSPDMFQEDSDDMEDFKPPKKKIPQQSHMSNKNRSVIDLMKRKGDNQTPPSPAVNSPRVLVDSQQSDIKPAPVPRMRVPKIFFATRTHKQIAQVVREFKKSPYSHVRMTILSSREHTCIRDVTPPFTNKNEMCRILNDRALNEQNPVANSGCLFKRNLSRAQKVGNIEDYLELDQSWDIEELVEAGKKKRICPYFASRDLLEKANIVFCPYNYLVDPSIRKSMLIKLKGNVIVFDEAHNIEDSMRDAVGFSLEETILERVVKECNNLLAFGGGASIKILRDHFQKLLDWMRETSVNLQQDKMSSERSCILTGTAYVAHMDSKGIGVEAFKLYSEAVDLLFEEDTPQNSQDSFDPDEAATVKIHQLHKPSQELKSVAEGLQLVWNYLYGSDFKFTGDYNVVLTEVSSRSFAEDVSEGGWRRAHGVTVNVQLVLKFWCMNPAVAFADFDEAHSVIVTSGTLSPMSSFQSELGVSFPHCLTTDHVIDPSQAWVASVSCGPNGREINGVYRNAITLEYQDEVGDSILQICKVVPFGVLCFFASYSTMDNVIKRWQMTGKWSQLLACKIVIKEPRNARDFSDSMHNFDLAVKKAEVIAARGTGFPHGEQTGALVLAVFRGKLSEGIDFKDNHARAVITVSIPFPSISDLQVKLKKSYNDAHQKQSLSLLPGNQWYEIQAFRALNQALGRCVRHRNDWGAIILLDSRFSPGSKASSSISKWATKQMKHFASWHNMYPLLKQFMEQRISQQDSELSLA